MKKIVVIISVFLFAILACTSSGDKKTPIAQDVEITPESELIIQEEPAQEKEVDVEPTEATQEISIQEVVILDQDGVKITVKELDQSWLGPEIKLFIENSSTENVTIQTRDLSVNDLMVTSIFSVDVAAGKAANDGITLSSSDLELAAIDTVKDIEFRFVVFKSESFETIFETEPLLITTTADPGYVQTFNEEGQLVYEGNGLRIIVQSLNDTTSFWGADLYVYIDNQSAQNVTVQVRNFSVNGMMVDPIFSSDVLAGKRVYDEISFLQSDLEENGITSINKLEFNFNIFDAESWSTIIDTDVIEVNFN